MKATTRAPQLSTGALVVLGLVLDAPRSGYELAAVAATSLGHFWPITKAHIYAELPRLEAAGCVVGERIAQSGAPDKVVYAATDAGKESFRQWLADADLGPSRLHHPLLLKVFFARWLGPRDLARVLDEAEARARGLRAGYVDRLGAMPRANGPRGTVALRGATLRYGVARLDAELAWIEELRASL